MIIAIDGPAGSGKSAVARAVAERLGYQCLDTGALYRALTWKAMKQGINKFFIEAELETRILRRYEELSKKDPRISLGEVRKDVKERDYRDSHRDVSPLTKAPDAVYIETTALTAAQVVEKILQYVL